MKRDSLRLRHTGGRTTQHFFTQPDGRGARLRRVHRDMHQHIRHRRCDIFLLDENILDPRLVPELDPRRPPDSGRQKSRPPVPAEVVRRLADIRLYRRRLRIDRMSRTRIRQMIRKRVDCRLHLGDRRDENDPQRIRARLQQFLRRQPPSAKHVVGVQHFLLIQIDGRKGVQPLEDQIGIRMRQLRGRQLKRGPVLPVRLADPLQRKLVVTFERFRNQSVRQQIGLHRSRHGRGAPCSCIRAMCRNTLRGDLMKLPPAIQLYRHTLGPKRSGK